MILFIGDKEYISSADIDTMAIYRISKIRHKNIMFDIQ